eukprot:CAMPEP_0205811568 /NCGR_PEP_ID=MMETSP0205-20121125/15789_1 /ASSEMBLY_ACC=CAM_ASM_000278 /TAXON_ID=36767 /ORGANISM="Euplotes focardii, Strain TN1" /LENGTH=65 /DNA_ID=CAMNT_0053090911 /DNA_START=36 /DNA_END=233 /DNA_ORIENTATION=+
MTHSKHKVVPYSKIEYERNLKKVPDLKRRLEQRAEVLEKAKENIRITTKDEITKLLEITQNISDK